MRRGASRSLRTRGLQRFRRSRRVGLLTLAGATLTLSIAAQTVWQSPAAIRDAASAHIAATLGDDATVEAVAVDERLKLPQCDVPLATETVRPLQRGQATVAVSCAGASSWRLFVPLRVTQQVGVLVARHDLAAGKALAASDIETRRLAATALPYDYLTDATDVVGLVARRALPAGSVLVGASLERAELVARGASVTLISGAGGVRVKSNGVALEPGRAHERVRVRSESGRIVEGVVELSGEVRVGS
jgi:flagellar basal body P-ring formation protein FlgA